MHDNKEGIETRELYVRYSFQQNYIQEELVLVLANNTFPTFYFHLCICRGVTRVLTFQSYISPCLSEL